MCYDAPRAVIELEHMGMPFSRTDEGKYRAAKVWRTYAAARSKRSGFEARRGNALLLFGGPHGPYDAAYAL